MKPNKITVKQINNSVQGNLKMYISQCENNYKSQIQAVVDYVSVNPNIKFIFLAGPSGSGKTTTSRIMQNDIENAGLKAIALSLDDFFVERKETPLWSDGTPNYETCDAIDWSLFKTCMQGLLNNQEVQLPTYNFTTGKKEFDKFTKLDNNSVFIVEGLHALNPIIETTLPKENCCKVFISANTDVYNGKKFLIDHSQVRFFRRLIRDFFTRSTSLEENAKMWKKVRLGEKLYISPYKDNADFYINSFHGYELCIYKKFFLAMKNQNTKMTNELLNDIVGLDRDVVPQDSVLQEFLPKN